MGKVLFMRKGETHTVPSNVPRNFVDATWEQIIEACQTNQVPDTWEVGDQKAMTINGTDYLIDIIGKNHDVYSDGSGYAPLTFQMHDCYATDYSMNDSSTNSGGWGGCTMRSTRMPSILALMPSEVQSGIKEVNKLTSAGNKSATINTSADKLFLLAEIEIHGRTYNAKSGEGTQYAYYSAGNSKIKYKNGNARAWWSRSPVGGNNRGFCYINTSGTYSTYDANNSQSIAFAFCF